MISIRINYVGFFFYFFHLYIFPVLDCIGYFQVHRVQLQIVIFIVTYSRRIKLQLLVSLHQPSCTKFICMNYFHTSSCELVRVIHLTSYSKTFKYHSIWNVDKTKLVKCISPCLVSKWEWKKHGIELVDIKYIRLNNFIYGDMRYFWVNKL